MVLEERGTATPRKPSAGSTRADPLRSSWFERAKLSRHHERRGAPFERLRCGACGSVLRPPRLPLSVHQETHFARLLSLALTPFAQDTRASTAPQPCPSPGRPTRRPPGRAVAEWSGRVIRRGRAESGEEWWSQPRARFIARATQSWSPRERSERGGSRRRSRLVMPKISDFRAARQSLL